MPYFEARKGKRDSVVATVLCGLGLALAFLAIAGAYVPYLDRVAVVLSAPAILLGIVATAVALGRNSRLVLPAITMLVAAVPAARYNWVEMSKVWVESAEICNAPGITSISVVGLLGSVAEGIDHRNVVGARVCKQLGKRFTDHDCDGSLGRIKCEL